MGPRRSWGTVLCSLLAGAACFHTSFAKEFLVEWDVPSNGLILPSVSTAKCGDTIRFKCPPGTTHGVFKMSSVNATCPVSFALPAAGVALAPPTRNCNFILTLGDEPDFFVTSQSPGACQQNLKMHVHSVCPSSGATYASNAFSAAGVPMGYGPGAVAAGISTQLPGQVMPAMNTVGAAGLSGRAYTAAPPGMIDQNMNLREQTRPANAAGSSQGSMLGLAGAVLAAVAAVLAF